MNFEIEVDGAMPPESSDPVFQENNQWYFWNEVWADRYGPYKDEAEARAKLREYCEQL